METLSTNPRRTMAWSLSADSLSGYLARQLSLFAWKDGQFTPAAIAKYLPATQARVERCFRGIRKKYFFDGERPVFNHAHGDHYAMFLYLFGNTVYRSGRDRDLADASFALNKALHGVDAYVSIELPEIFLFVHPLGTILGAARYRDYFMVYQNCTIGSTDEGRYPEFSEGTVLCAKSAVIGACRVGRDVIFGANSFVLNVDVPDQTTVVGVFPGHRFLPNKTTVAERFFA